MPTLSASRRPPTLCWPSTPTSVNASATTTSRCAKLLVHRIEEYARHCGHADLLRECVDGRVGQ
ncbi:DUF664 domain-containing protein [Aeromicrobium sp. UC242_57]|uniref:mycothiol transferase n=1 Tax=Aeromicrobium sp. UC242_57 TaxID=3374624 RepID=UPI0037915177